MSSIELWTKQQEVFNFACSKREVALLCEQRTGKTFITMKLMEHRTVQFESEDVEFVGIHVAILNNKESTWEDNLRKHLPQIQLFTDWDVFKRARGHRLLLVHYEELRSLIRKLVKHKKFNWASVDEAHRLYNRGSGQSRAMARLSWIEWKLILTGTPMEKKPTDFFAQFLFLNPNVFGKNYARFEDRWLDWKKIDFKQFVGMRPGGPAWKQKVLQQRILKNKAKFREELMPEFVALLKPYCIRIEKTDVGIIPPIVEVHKFKLGQLHMERYESMRDQSWVELPGGEEVLAGLPVTRVMKLRQMASGFIFNEDHELSWLTGGKVAFTLRIFESLPKPVVIFSAFVPELLRIHRELEAGGYDVALVYGKTPKKTRPAIWRAFQAGQLDAVVCQTSAGGVGVDLWKANHAIVTSLGYSSIVWDQAKARLDSRNKSFPGKIHLVLAENTIDEDLYDLVVLKNRTTQSVLSQLKRRYSWQKKLLPPPANVLRPRARSSRSTTSRTSRPT